MTDILNDFVNNTVQCWGCAIFERMFQVISDAAAVMYEKLTSLALIIFALLFMVFIVNAVYQNIKGGGKDPLYIKSVVKVIVSSVVVLTLLFAGVSLPRAITRITFEPAATAVLAYTQALTKQTDVSVNEHVTYQSTEIDEAADTGFYRPQLRDTIIMIIKTTITQFQSFMKLGIAVISKSFEWSMLLSIGDFIKHIGLLLLGVAIFYTFFKLFVGFCFYFIDIIVAMAFFAFLFPISLMLMAFDGAEHLPEAVGNIKKTVNKDQVKRLVNAIVSMGACVITYVIIIMIVGKFLSDPNTTTPDLMEKILAGDVFSADLSTTNLELLTLSSVAVLAYVLVYIYKQIPTITKMILDTFGVAEEKQIGEKVGQDVIKTTKNAVNTVIDGTKTLLGKDKK